MQSIQKLDPKRCVDLKFVIFKLLSRIDILAFPVKFPTHECHKTPLMSSQHRFIIGSGNGLVPDGTISWTSVDPELCLHMASLGHNKHEFTHWLIGLWEMRQWFWQHNFWISSYSLISWALPELVRGECHWTWMMISQPWFRKWLKVSVAVNYQYRRYESIWKFRSIIDMDFSISIYRVSNLTLAAVANMDSKVPWVRVRTKELWQAHAN